MAQSSRAAAAVESDATKETLQRQMDETRDSISQTVTDIKDTVADQLQSVKDSVSETLDWREQFRTHPLAWCLGALSVGYVLGNSVQAALHGTKSKDHLLSQLAALGDHFADELSKQGMSILAPALTGTVLVPVLASQLSQLTGLDLTDFAKQLLTQNTDTPAQQSGKGKKKKGGGKKLGKKKA